MRKLARLWRRAPRRRPRPRPRSAPRRPRSRRVLRWVGLLIVLLGAAGALFVDLAGRRAPSLPPPVATPLALALGSRVDLKAIADAITEMDLERASALIQKAQGVALSVVDSTRLSFERARLALYVGDCDSADAILGALSGDDPQRAGLARLAKQCSGAVAAGLVVEDRERGVWLRIQDWRDEGIAPFITDIAVKARDAVEYDLGVRLPRPLRIDLVRDLFSLAAVSGLPLESAETTGTVAVARWGRVTLLSPQAARHGYPWQDTLAHEIVHLALSRGTRDHAPLWLQEGVAKRGEVRWREPRPFDAGTLHDRVAKAALESGTSVGVDNLGPSIAMLPSADAAALAFSEVTSFMSYWIDQNGRTALHLLLSDLKGIQGRDPDPALRSVSGYSLKEWIARWQAYLRALPPLDPSAEEPLVPEDAGLRLSRATRYGDLLLSGQHFAAAERYFAEAVELAPSSPSFRARLARARLGTRDEAGAREALGSFDDVAAPHAAWLALHARFAVDGAREAGDATAAGQQASRDATWALGLDPWSELVACEGHAAELRGADPWLLHTPTSPASQRLCELARARPSVR